MSKRVSLPNRVHNWFSSSNIEKDALKTFFLCAKNEYTDPQKLWPKAERPLHTKITEFISTYQPSMHSLNKEFERWRCNRYSVLPHLMMIIFVNLVKLSPPKQN